MSWWTRRFGSRRRKAVFDPGSFFYVREWACAPQATIDQVAQALALEPIGESAFAAGIEALADTKQRFVVASGGGVFVFGTDLGFSDIAERLSASLEAGYSVFLNDKRMNILCRRAVRGVVQREVAFTGEPVSSEGEPLPGEPALGESLDEDTVLALAAAWGPDPRALVRELPAGRLYTS